MKEEFKKALELVKGFKFDRNDYDMNEIEKRAFKGNSRRFKKKMKFKPEDFSEMYVETDPGFCRQINEDDVHEIVEIANAKLQEWLDAAPTVRGEEGRLGEGYTPSIAEWNRKILWDGDETHKAKLVLIEEITEEERYETEEIK